MTRLPRAVAFAAALAAAVAACGPPQDHAPPGLALEDATSRPPPAFEPATAVVRVHYPAKGASITLRGEGSLAGEIPCVAYGPESCSAELTAFPAGSKVAALRPYLDGTPARGARYLVSRGETLDLYPHFVRARGELRVLFPAFHSQALEPHAPGNQRVIFAYLPASYEENTAARYPVVYLHDGRNLFDAASSITGVEWEVDESAEDAWERTGAFAELIVIGVDQFVTVEGQLQNRRQGEYNPTPRELAWPPCGDAYADFLATELKPAVDAALRTRPGREHTATLGSSLGATISTWAAFRHPGVFGRYAGLSPATAIDNGWITARLSTSAANAPRLSRVYLDLGSVESGGNEGLLALYGQAYRGLGYTFGAELLTHFDLSGGHTERAWARRLPEVLGFLFPDRRAR